MAEQTLDHQLGCLVKLARAVIAVNLSMLFQPGVRLQMLPWSLLLPQRMPQHAAHLNPALPLELEPTDSTALTHRTLVSVLTTTVRRPHEALALALTALQHAQSESQGSARTADPMADRNSAAEQRSSADGNGSHAGSAVVSADAACSMLLFAMVRAAVRVFKGAQWRDNGLHAVNALWTYLAGVLRMTQTAVSDPGTMARALLGMALAELCALDDSAVAAVTTGAAIAGHRAGAGRTVTVSDGLPALATFLQVAAALCGAAPVPGGGAVAVPSKRARSAAATEHIQVLHQRGNHDATPQPATRQGGGSGVAVATHSHVSADFDDGPPATYQQTRMLATLQAACADATTAPTVSVDAAHAPMAASPACITLSLALALRGCDLSSAHWRWLLTSTRDASLASASAAQPTFLLQADAALAAQLRLLPRAHAAYLLNAAHAALKSALHRSPQSSRGVHVAHARCVAAAVLVCENVSARFSSAQPGKDRQHHSSRSSSDIEQYRVALGSSSSSDVSQLVASAWELLALASPPAGSIDALLRLAATQARPHAEQAGISEGMGGRCKLARSGGPGARGSGGAGAEWRMSAG